VIETRGGLFAGVTAVPSHISGHYVLWGTIPLAITYPREQFRLLYSTSKGESAGDAGAPSGPAVARVGGRKGVQRPSQVRDQSFGAPAFLAP